MFDRPVNLVNRELNFFFKSRFLDLILKEFDFSTEHAYLTNKKTNYKIVIYDVSDILFHIHVNCTIKN
jgi:hypothetical protein